MAVGVTYLFDCEHRDTDTLVLCTKDQGYPITCWTGRLPPISNPNSLLPVATVVGHDPTIKQLIG